MSKSLLIKLLSLLILAQSPGTADAQSNIGSAVEMETAQLRRLGFTVTGECKVSAETGRLIPYDFVRSNPPWGVQQYTCKNGGYKLERYSGQPYTMLSCRVGAWLDVGHGKRCDLSAAGFVVEGELACLYLVAAAECGLAPGIIPINSVDVVKE